MIGLLRCLLAVMALLVFPCCTFAADDAGEGYRIAKKYCDRCHNVEPGGPFKEHPPSFAAIAVYRSTEQIFGRIVYPPQHSSMPQIGFMLTPENVGHLVAYIRSLDRQ